MLLSLQLFAQENKDSLSIVRVLREDYKTMVTHDIRKHMGFCTDKYTLIENGEIWNMAREAEGYRKDAGRVLERKDDFHFRFIRIYGETAYAVYNLQSVITENGITTHKNWNESVIFRKLDGQWKIELIHSTPIRIE